MDLSAIEVMLAVIKPEYSPINLLGKLFFWRLSPWQQRSKIIIVMWSIIVGLAFGAAVMMVILIQNGRH